MFAARGRLTLLESSAGRRDAGANGARLDRTGTGESWRARTGVGERRSGTGDGPTGRKGVEISEGEEGHPDAGTHAARECEHGH